MSRSNINKGNFSGIMAVILGFLSRPCCSVPFFLALFGLGSAGLVETLFPYRHLFLGVSVVSFTISGWIIFRVKGALFNKLFFITSVVFTFLFLYLPELLFNL